MKMTGARPKRIAATGTDQEGEPDGIKAIIMPGCASVIEGERAASTRLAYRLLHKLGFDPVSYLTTPPR